MSDVFKAFAWGAFIAVYFCVGLEPTGWFFYEASFFLGFDSLYWGYSVFRGGAYALSLWAYQKLFCVGIGLLVTLWKLRKLANKNKKRGKAV